MSSSPQVLDATEAVIRGSSKIILKKSVFGTRIDSPEVVAHEAAHVQELSHDPTHANRREDGTQERDEPCHE